MTIRKKKGIHGKGRDNKKGILNDDFYSKNSKSIIQIKNDDSICLARALVVAIAHQKHVSDGSNDTLKKELKAVRDSRRGPQKHAAEELMATAGVTVEECPTALVKFQAVVDYRIVVLESTGTLPSVKYSGPEFNTDGSQRQCVYILNYDDHFDVVTKVHAIFGNCFFCNHCFKAYQKVGAHRCEAICKMCYTSPPCANIRSKKCDQCLRTFRSDQCFANHSAKICKVKFICKKCDKFVNMTDRKDKHKCGESYCKVCNEHVEGGHLCYIKTKKQSKEVKSAAFIFYDLETVQVKAHEKGGLEHQAYLLVSHKVCTMCIGKEEDRCDVCGVRERVFVGGTCVASFMEYICSEEFKKFKRVTCIAHNAKAYDAQWVLKWMIEVRKWAPEVVETGSKLMRIEIHNLTFLDSINFIPFGLSKFTASFGLPAQTVKGHFPHFLFNVVDHPFDIHRPVETNYVSDSLPPLEAYDPDGMTPGDRTKFLAWYEGNRGSQFDFLRECLIYCKMDVTVLRQGCTEFRKIYLEKAQIDPFLSASTIAGTCMEIFKKHFLKKDLIGIIPAGGYRMKDRQSAIAAKYLSWIESQLGRPLESAINGREAKIAGFKVDGYDAATRTIFEFMGCHFHGCPTCIQDRLAPYHGDPHSSAQTVFEATQARTAKLRQAGYKVEEMWECRFNQLIKTDSALKLFSSNFKLDEKFNVLNPRDAFFGGRTEAIELYRRCEVGERIFYQDFTSLYPWANKNAKYPIRHPKIFLKGDPHFPKLEDSEGLLKCRVLPPRGLYLPVLPCRFDGKLFFSLCRTCSLERGEEECRHSDEDRMLFGTWVTCELKKAVSLGYTIVDSLELWHFEETCKFDKSTGEEGIFSGYVNMWLKLKQEASGWGSPDMTEQQKQEYIHNYKVHEGITLDYNNISFNPGLRLIAKLNLNSLWGKLGQRADLTKTEIINESDRWFKLLYDPSIEVKSVFPVNEEVIVSKWKYEKEVDLVQRSQNSIIAAYTTAIARLKLYSLLEVLQERVLYFDTDSVIYTCGPQEEPLPTGEFLGQLTDELSGYGQGAFICEFASGGSKNYGYQVAEGAETFKCKGIRLNHRNASLVNFDTLKRQLGVDGPPCTTPVIVSEPRGIVRLQDHTVVSKPQTKTYRIVYDKRRRLPEFKTLPWGY